MADNHNPNSDRNAGAKMDDRGGQDQQSPARNQQDQQSAGQRSGQPDKDQGLGKGQQGNRDLNEGGLEKGGSERSGRETE